MPKAKQKVEDLTEVEGEQAQAVTAAKPADVAVLDLPDMSQYEGAGLEEAGVDDFALPFLRILQKGSPQVDPDDGAYMDGEAKAGDFFNTVSSRIYPRNDGVEFIPVKFRRAEVEFKPSRGGFVAEHAPGSDIVKTATPVEEGSRKMVLPNGNDLVTTYYFYVLIIKPEGGYSPAIMAFASTQLKKARKLNTMINERVLARPDGSLYKPAAWAFKYAMTVSDTLVISSLKSGVSANIKRLKFAKSLEPLPSTM